MQFIIYDAYDYIILTMIILHWHNLNFPFNIIKHTLKVYMTRVRSVLKYIFYMYSRYEKFDDESYLIEII